jgi:hypothetical protein
MPYARIWPEKKSWEVLEVRDGSGKDRIWDRPEDGSRAVGSMFSAREAETRISEP